MCYRRNFKPKKNFIPADFSYLLVFRKSTIKEHPPKVCRARPDYRAGFCYGLAPAPADLAKRSRGGEWLGDHFQCGLEGKKKVQFRYFLFRPVIPPVPACYFPC